jgi:hypothetical protein
VNVVQIPVPLPEPGFVIDDGFLEDIRVVAVETQGEGLFGESDPEATVERRREQRFPGGLMGVVALHALAVGHRRMNRLFFPVLIVAVMAQGRDPLRQKETFCRMMGIVTGEALPFGRWVVEVRF